MTIKTDKLYKGTQLIFGDEAKLKGEMEAFAKNAAGQQGYNRMYMPNMYPEQAFAGKVGNENNNLMFTFVDQGNRLVALAPEYTAIFIDLARNHFKSDKDVKAYYVQECFRSEEPQLGRYRQFTQFGVEVLNPTLDYQNDHIELVKKVAQTAYAKREPVKDMTEYKTRYKEAEQFLDVKVDVTRGLEYYTGGKGFEIHWTEPGVLGNSTQIAGGGVYQGGQGFAVGMDRIALIRKPLGVAEAIGVALETSK